MLGALQGPTDRTRRLTGAAARDEIARADAAEALVRRDANKAVARSPSLNHLAPFEIGMRLDRAGARGAYASGGHAHSCRRTAIKGPLGSGGGPLRKNYEWRAFCRTCSRSRVSS